MGMKGRVLAVFAGVIVIAAVAVTAAFGAHKADPGITSSSILIGGTFPLTGVASLYKTIPAAEAAYFAYVNDHGGVNGRKINFDNKDDAYNPAQTVPLTQQLVEQDKVFAIFGGLGFVVSVCDLVGVFFVSIRAVFGFVVRLAAAALLLLFLGLQRFRWRRRQLGDER